jgi:hypothetical protein
LGAFIGMAESYEGKSKAKRKYALVTAVEQPFHASGSKRKRTNGPIRAVADKLLIDRMGTEAALLVQKVLGEEKEDWSFELNEAK